MYAAQEMFDLERGRRQEGRRDEQATARYFFLHLLRCVGSVSSVALFDLLGNALKRPTGRKTGDEQLQFERHATESDMRISDAELVILLAHEQRCSNYVGDEDYVLCVMEQCECLRVVRILRDAIETLY